MSKITVETFSTVFNHRITKGLSHDWRVFVTLDKKLKNVHNSNIKYDNKIYLHIDQNG